ncbi:hypothetical protein BP6252_11023 [Coleophoma cylindrospora]|uniref:Heterokaryon incompatibility domain-containing protein n=1 Tax=Coleophoma cylindrospora TaxID=1849047 RepID=A0A3D8QP68_9HELO|nr:hypothetical protein BP6252_11023 [Coleophoma cylindrospora]
MGDIGMFSVFYTSLKRLQSSGESGCSSCGVLANVAQGFSSITELQLEIAVRLFARSCPEISCFCEEFGHVWVQIYRTEPGAFGPAVPSTVFQHIPTLPKISQSAWSDDAQNFLQSRLVQCCQSHPACKLEEARLPSRVVYVGATGDEQVRIIETHAAITGRYTALSYCWGIDVEVKTTTKNLQEYQSGLLLSKLPQTIIDAIRVTRFLGVRYLWVDALCILQDSEADWELEAAEMAQVYEGAFLVIAASSAYSADKGFLHVERENKSILPLRISSIDGSEVFLAARIRPWSGLHKFSHHDDQDPLARRAWCLQEKILSRRLVSFSYDELQWSCRTETTCECGGVAGFSHRPSPEKLQPDNMTAEDAFLFWCHTVGEYSSRQLTFTKDKLAAVAGIAKMLHSKTGSHYIAGLWEDDLIHGLLWSRVPRDRNPPGSYSACTNYRAPSFSWASVDFQVYFPIRIFGSQRVEIPIGFTCEASATLSNNNNPYGQVTNSWLKITAPIVAGLVYPSEYEFYSTFHSGRLGPIEVGLDDNIFVGVDTPSYSQEVLDNSQMARRKKEVETSTAISSADQQGVQAWAIYMGFSPFSNQGDREVKVKGRSGQEIFLIVRRSLLYSDKFERIGFGKIRKEAKDNPVEFSIEDMCKITLI